VCGCTCIFLYKTKRKYEKNIRITPLRNARKKRT
jgi:hypothetical protein